MNKKIPVSKLAELTAERAGCNAAEASQFIKDLFAIVESEIMTCGESEIPGLGKFIKSNQPGEPLEFIPDEDFAALLNEYFSSFTAVKLNDGVTDDILDEANDDGAQTDIKTNNHDVEAQEEGLPLTETALSEESGNEETISEEEDAKTADAKEAMEEMAIDVPPELPEELEKEQVAYEANEVQSTVTNELTAEHSEEISVTAVTPASSKENTDNVQTLEPHIATTEDTPEEIAEEEVEYVVVKRQKSRFWLGLTLGLVLGFALGVIAYLAYMLHYLKLPVEDITGF